MCAALFNIIGLGKKLNIKFLIFMVKKNPQPTDNKHKKIKEMEAVSDAYRCI